MSNLDYLIVLVIAFGAVVGAGFGYLVIKAIELHYYVRAHTPRA